MVSGRATTPDELKNFNQGLKRIVERLDLQAGPPTKENILEKDFVNLGITFISQGQKFIPVPIPGTTYLWALTSIKDDDGPGYHPELNMGIQYPFDPQNLAVFETRSQTVICSKTEEHSIFALEILKIKNLSADEAKEQLMTKSGEGHTTIAANAFIAGELVCSLEKTAEDKPIWYLNDQSGRFSYKIIAYAKCQFEKYGEQHRDEIIDKDKFINDKINEILSAIAEHLENILNIKIIPKPFHDIKTNPKKIWLKALNKEGQVMNPEQKDCWTLGQHGVHLLMKSFKQYCEEMGALEPKQAPLYIHAKKILIQFNKDTSLDKLLDFLNMDEHVNELCSGPHELKNRFISFVEFLKQEWIAMQKHGLKNYLMEHENPHSGYSFSPTPDSVKSAAHESDPMPRSISPFRS